MREALRIGRAAAHDAAATADAKTLPPWHPLAQRGDSCDAYPEVFMEDEAGSEHLPKRLDGERLEAGPAGGSPQRGVGPPLWWSLRSTASMRLWPTSRRSPSRLRLPAVPKPKMWSVSCLRGDLHRGNLHRDVDEPAESCTPVQGPQ